MEKIDRLGWAAGFSFRAYGLRIGIRTNNATVLEDVERRLPFGWGPAKAPVVDNLYSILVAKSNGRSNVRRFNLLYRGVSRLARTMDLDDLLGDLEIDLHSYVAAQTLRRVFLHAGAVGWRGRAIIIPGKNFSGKTNLVTAFLRAGAAYYSDEFTVLDARGRVHPYPWALHVREQGLAQPRQCQAEMLGAKAGKKPLPVGWVILSEYRQGARWRPKPLTQGRAALAILANVMSTRHPAEAMLPTVRQAVSEAMIFTGVRGEAGEVVDSILNGISN